MESPGSIGLLDSNGEPFPDHIQRTLVRLSARLRREFPVLQDDVALTEVMEEAARRIAELSAGTFCTFRRELSSLAADRLIVDVRRTCNVLDDLTLSGVSERPMIIRMPNVPPAAAL